MVVIMQSCSSTGSQHSATSMARESECRLVRHALGVTCVPTNPQRVITLSVPSLANALSLGVTPIATIVYFDEPPPYLAKRLQFIEILGKEEQPDLERILDLKPDLIIGLQASTEAIYTQLSHIAPTVAGEWSGYPSWRAHFDFVAEVLGKTDRASEVWKHYEQRIGSLKTALKSSRQNPEVSFVHTCCGTIDLDLKNSFNGSIMEDVGLRRPSAQAETLPGGMMRLSRERLMDMDGDVLFVAADGTEASQTITRLKQDPFWKKLRAVQADRVYPVNYPTWRGGNPLAADAVIDDLSRYLVDNNHAR
jgi:iron complex transport system substrate-binding protein